MAQTPVPPPPTPIAPGAGSADWTRILRRVLVYVASIAFALAALIGIILLWGEIAPSEAVGRFFAFLFLTGFFSLTALAAIIPIDRAGWAPLGWSGMVASGIGLLLSLIIVLGTTPDEGFAKMLGLVGNLCSSAALAALLLLVYRRSPLLDRLIVATIVLLGILFVIFSVLVVGEVEPSGVFLKVLATLNILAFLGLIVIPLTALVIGRHEIRSPGVFAEAPGPLLPPQEPPPGTPPAPTPPRG